VTSDNHRAARTNDFFREHHLALARQGTVVSSTRVRGGRRLGPYYRLECRLPTGTKVALYLGNGALVAAVRRRLSELRRPLRQHRNMEKLHRHLRRGARAARVNLAQELSKIGSRLQGTEFRGFAHGKPASSTLLERSILEK
jgi:hypothetical protein